MYGRAGTHPTVVPDGRAKKNRSRCMLIVPPQQISEIMVAPQRGQCQREELSEWTSSVLLLPRRRGTGGQQLSAQGQAGNTKAIGEKPKVPNACEAFGKHVQKEATQELYSDQGHRALLAAMGVILPAEGHALCSKANQR
jgi:hypothetical protein